ncbi:MAG: glycosyl hydrolase [Gemmatimonadetes bacterium]|nr:glycosyl hydrolase [Gemmatimonadota bacterium]
MMGIRADAVRRFEGRFALVTAMVLAIPMSTSAQQVDPSLLAGLSYRFIGPDGNRVSAVMGEPGNDLVMYVGAASGGLWKTENGGVSWRPIFDGVEASSVAALAMAPSDPNIIWVGTGETFIIRPAHAMGDGIYRSTDAGRSWNHVGLEKTGRIGRIRVDPRDSDVVFACALGHTYGPQPDRGVYRTEDGGDTWELVLHVSEDSGCIDLAMDPTNPRILFAAFWDIHISTWGLDSGGPDSGVWRSMDGGDTWERLSHEGLGLPSNAGQTIGKIAVEVAPSDPGRVYVLTEEESPRFYRSDDYGSTWRLVLTNHTINERAPYYTRIGVDPENADRVYFISVRFSMTLDGGRTLVPNPPRGGGDTHDVWIDPTNAKRIMVGDDGGANVSLDHGASFRRVNLPIAQMYHVAVDDEIPYNVYGNRQDGYSYRGPSNSRTGSIPLGLWQDVGGCESGFAQPDPTDANIVWSGCYDGGLERYDHRTKQARNVRIWPEASYGWAPADVKYRWHWNFPLHISPHDHNTVYAGSQYVHRTTDGGQSWEEISPDLTLNLKDHQQNSGGVAFDNLMTYDGALLFSIAESPVESGLIWAGTNDGQVQLTRDAGATWVNVTENIPDLPPWGTIASIEPSRHASGTAYISVDLHQMGDFDPYIYKTENYGRSWKKISDGIPSSPHSFVHVTKEDPKRAGMLFAGTDNSVWFSLDDGEHWNKLRLNMPPAPVYWLVIQERFDDLVVATYGRGFYIMDDISPLRALDADVLASGNTVFDILPAYRFQAVQGIKTESSFVTGRNPRYGAGLNYFLADTTQRVRITVVGPAGDTVRTLDGSRRRGLNRAVWDLRHAPSRRASRRTRPPDRPWVELGADGTRNLRTWDLDLNPGQRGPLVVPGLYEVRVSIGDEVVSKTVEVLKDPYSAGTMADIRTQVALSLRMRDQLNDMVDFVDRLEWARKQLEDVQGALARDSSASEIVTEARRAEELAVEVEGAFFDVQLTGAREDAFRAPMRLYGRFSALATDVGASSADFPPTTQQVAVHDVLTERLQAAMARAEAFFADELDRLNEMLSELGRPQIVSDLP